MEIAIDDAVAILIDADNLSYECLENVIKLAEYYGHIFICRAYGDWEESRLASWIPITDEVSIDGLPIKQVQINRIRKNVADGRFITEPDVSLMELVQVDQIGKDATDGVLMTEAGRIVGEYKYETAVNLTTFIIVSGDGHYASSVKHYQDKGMKVIGIGRKGSISCDLETVSDQFYTIEQLDKKVQGLQKQHLIPPNEVRAFAQKLVWAYANVRKKHNSDWVNLGELGQELRKVMPDYDNQFGHHQLSEWMNSLSHEYECEDQKTRKIDHNPDFTRYQMLIDAFLECKADRVSCLQLEEALRQKSEERFETYFHDKKLTNWLALYSRFSVENDMVSINQNASIFHIDSPTNT